jgi:hypothetical protein
MSTVPWNAAPIFSFETKKERDSRRDLDPVAAKRESPKPWRATATD